MYLTSVSKTIWVFGDLFSEMLLMYRLQLLQAVGKPYHKSRSFRDKTDGTLWAWGSNTAGQLGDGTSYVRSVPVQIGTSANWKSVYVGNRHTLAIKTDGTLWAWGDNKYGQLGDGTLISKTAPIQIGTATDWQSLVVEQNIR
jgi:hypothetical protein